MKTGIILIIVGVITIMGAVAFALYQTAAHEPATAACTLEGKTCPDGTIVGREGPHCEFAACPTMGKKATFSWKFEDAPEEDEAPGVPQTRVILVFNHQDYHLGTYEGTCSAIADSGSTLLPEEQEGAICWFGGAGTEIGVFLEGERLQVKRGVLEEPTAETEGMRGEFVTIYTLQ